QPVSKQPHPPGKRGAVQWRIDYGFVEAVEPVAECRFVGGVEEIGIQPIASGTLDGERSCSPGRRFTREVRPQERAEGNNGRRHHGSGRRRERSDCNGCGSWNQLIACSTFWEHGCPKLPKPHAVESDLSGLLSEAQRTRNERRPAR